MNQRLEKPVILYWIALLCIVSLTSDLLSRALYDSHGTNNNFYPRIAVSTPNTQYDVHNIGKFAVMITNFGTFGSGFVDNAICDGEQCPSAEYPINSDIEYLFAGALWIGAVIGRDTLVSVGSDGWFIGITELLPDAGDDGAIISRSNLKSKSTYDTNAKSEQDFICSFTDTFADPGLTGIDPIDNRPHIPLHVAVEQSSYAWSYEYAEDFIIMDYKIKNIGQFPIRKMFLGVYVDGDAYHSSLQPPNSFQDDICGFRKTVAMPSEFCIDEDTINIAWIADNDGDPSTEAGWAFSSSRAVTGSRVVRTPNEDLSYSFNWWISHGSGELDFGPRKRGTDDDPFRSFGTHLGTPTGDVIKYYVMSHSEFDYDQLESAISHTSEGYMPPPPPDRARDFADGYDTRYLLSFGPFDVFPDSVLPVTLAFVAGDEFHVRDRDYNDFFDESNPDQFYKKLDFTDLGANARWASWIFDNPGVDTDEDGDSGRFCWEHIWDDTTLYIPGDSFIIDSNKIFYAGDGIPDFRGASPPPPPVVTVSPGFGEVTIRWNGQETENSVDVFSRQKDFEGYRVYYSEGRRLSDFILLTSFDVEDYRVYQFNTILLTWDQNSIPLTIDSLKNLYGQDFEPATYYNEFNYFTDPVNNNLYYFQPQDWNQSDVSGSNSIRKVYPNASRHDLSDTTDSGWLRFYEYEYTVKNLQPSKPYYFSVTAFDYGSLKVDLGALESSPLINAVQEYPLPSSDQVESEGMSVIVFPNPYRINAGYAEDGYENRNRSRSTERTRAIRFANLPKVCKIRIYTISGDLVKEIDHNQPDGGPKSQFETWDVISKNTQAVVTGLYLWHVESEMGDQIGKLVIIK